MKNFGKILSVSKRVIANERPRRRERVERRPMVEAMEPRALLSGLETGVAPAIPSHHAGTAMMIPITENSPLHVVYQTNHPGGSIGLTRSAPVVISPAAQGVARQPWTRHPPMIRATTTAMAAMMTTAMPAMATAMAAVMTTVATTSSTTRTILRIRHVREADRPI